MHTIGLLLKSTDAADRAQGHILLCALHPEFSACGRDAYQRGHRDAATEGIRQIAWSMARRRKHCPLADWPLYARGYAALARACGVELAGGEAPIPLID